MVSFKQGQCGEQPLGVQEGKQGNGLGSNCSDQVKKGWELVYRSWEGSSFSSLFYFLV